MSENEQRGENRVPIALRIKLRYRKVDTFISKFATNISANGMFISSRKPKEEGTLLRFELRLADDSTVIAGQGKVAWVRHFDPAQPKQPHGMGIEFTGLSNGSRETIAQIVAARLEAGLGEADEIPFAVKTPAPPAAVSKAPEAAAPMQAQSSSSLPAEASAAVAFDLSHIDNSQVDLAAAVARARALVGSAELDDELEKLYRVSAAPVAETVDEASNDLARMFGGKAVQARRLRHFDPPTGVEISAAPPAAGDDDDDDDDEEILDAPAVAADAVIAALAARDESDVVYQRGQTRALTDESPEIIGEFDAPASDSASVEVALDSLEEEAPADAALSALDVSLASLEDSVDDELPLIESESHIAASNSEAPMHLDDSADESLDIDIDEEPGAPPIPVQASEPKDIEIVDAAGGDFAEGAMELTDLLELPPTMDSSEEIDVDLD